MSKPTMLQIAESPELWKEYVDPQNNDPELFGTTTVEQRINIQRELWPDELDDDDDDTPAMPTLDAALALLESMNPEAANAARAYLDGNENKTTTIKTRVTLAEKVQIQRTAKALGYASASEFIRARVMA